MKFYALPLIIFLTVSLWLPAQQIDVFPAYTGDELLGLLVQNYKPATVLNYTQARDTLFSKIDAVHDTLTCVYTDFSIYLNPNEDPTVAAFMGGGANGINTEHTYPTSKGAEAGNAKSDMHHLFPTRIDVNATRANEPFAEIDDNQTTKWYYLNQLLTNIPTDNIDLYSEFRLGGFEPRESHKGDIARAMFYFYTMYKDQADAADNTFFPAQQATLCQWHLADPVDTKEWERTNKIALYQDDKPNPFVLDCTLAARTYCPGQECQVNGVVESEPKKPYHLFQNTPNPFDGQTEISYTLNQPFEVELFLTDVLGRHVGTLVHTKQFEGEYKVTLEAPGSGMWFCHLVLKAEGHVYHGMVKMVMGQ